MHVQVIDDVCLSALEAGDCMCSILNAAIIPLLMFLQICECQRRGVRKLLVIDCQITSNMRVACKDMK